jgi:hypothetical protein
LSGGEKSGRRRASERRPTRNGVKPLAVVNKGG